ncbi:E3 ubiquitin-protein ligase mib1-like isoform X2 [Ostrea edulis]|uniref:E3 ubiquitin-protein ligase mib1-like isoform X2 n=1 Tax=Ostrea edulis TaxID=37623 RepID=UPI00209444E8|nr:E3 ubiquitin-protein ligase mib1-like isoform X2 [Ostrea edulis]
MFSLYPRNSWCRENSDVTNMADSWYHCRCGIYFATEARYQRHQCFLTNNADRPVDERAEKVKTNMESKTFFQCEECGDFFDDMTIFQNHACARARDHQDPNAQVLCDVREPSKDEKECVICMETTPDCVLCDCGHLVTCMECGKKITVCPVCRAEIRQRIKVFM